MKTRGFTLVELITAVAVVGILAAIALPGYQSSIRKSKRAGAQAQMMDIANREQQYLVANREYATKTVLESNGYSLPSEVSSVYTYSVTLGSATVPAFTITFAATGAQASDGDLTLTSEGDKGPAGKW